MARSTLPTRRTVLPHGAEGFTLVELMIVIAVLAILASVGIPSFQGIIASNRLSTATNDVLLGLTLAKNEAIRQNTSIRYCINPTTRQWRVLTLTGTDIRIGNVHSGVTVASASLDTTSVASNACVRFRSDGLSYGSAGLMTAGTITLSLSGNTRTVNIRTGAIHAG